MSLKDKLLDVLVPWRAIARDLKGRNDYLVAANNRLGITILEHRKEIKRISPRKPKQKVESLVDDRLKVAKYLHHVEQERQKMIIQALRDIVDTEDFKRICDKYNSMSDVDIAGSYGEKMLPTKAKLRGAK